MEVGVTMTIRATRAIALTLMKDAETGVMTLARALQFEAGDVRGTVGHDHLNGDGTLLPARSSRRRF